MGSWANNLLSLNNVICFVWKNNEVNNVSLVGALALLITVFILVCIFWFSATDTTHITQTKRSYYKDMWSNKNKTLGKERAGGTGPHQVWRLGPPIIGDSAAKLVRPAPGSGCCVDSTALCVFNLWFLYWLAFSLMLPQSTGQLGPSISVLSFDILSHTKLFISCIFPSTQFLRKHPVLRPAHLIHEKGRVFCLNYEWSPLQNWVSRLSKR